MRTTNPAKAKSLTLDNRLTMSEMPDMALNKVMVGQGAGNSPVALDDYPQKPARPWATNWSVPGWMARALVAQVVVAGIIYYCPIFVAKTTTYSRIGINVAIGDGEGGIADLRIFNWNNGAPGSLILSAGTVSTDAGGQQEININQQLTRGYYFTAIRCTQAPLLYGMDSGYAISCPVEGSQPNNNVNTLDVVHIVTAAYADPAPAPTDMLPPMYVFVALREN